jgi:hypothetical protein
MATPTEDIEAFLKPAGSCQTRRIELAIFFAEAMLRELHASVSEWETTLDALQDARRRGFAVDSN